MACDLHMMGSSSLPVAATSAGTGRASQVGCLQLCSATLKAHRPDGAMQTRRVRSVRAQALMQSCTRAHPYRNDGKGIPNQRMVVTVFLCTAVLFQDQQSQHP